MPSTDAAFTGSIPALYDRLLVPLLFTPWAKDLVARVSPLHPPAILETAAGTGVVTAQLRRHLPDAQITATDLNPAMLELASVRPRMGPVTFTPADAQQLPFEDEKFDALACQFGIMFLPDRAAAFREAHRVLRRGGLIVFNVWNSLEHNPVSNAVGEALAKLFPADPPRFLERIPFGYHDTAQIAAEVAEAGFADVIIDTPQYRHGHVTARDAADGMCRGTPLSAEIAAHGPDALTHAVKAAAKALERFCGTDGKIDAPMSAHVVTARAS